jgi:hypothetical protein
MKVPTLIALLACQWLSTSTSQAAPPTPYRCDAIIPANQTATASAELVGPWRALAAEKDTDGTWRGRVRALADTPLPKRIDTETRVRAQHAMLQIARELDGVDRARVMTRVRDIAPTAAALAALGAATQPRVAAIFGGDITERATRSCAGGNSIHVMAFRGLSQFRPLRAGSTHALVEQLVAFDRDGNAHATPLVAAMELRVGAPDDADAPACVVEAGSDGRLIPVADASEVHAHPPFVRRGEQACNGCHRNGSVQGFDVVDRSELARIDALRERQLMTLAAQTWAQLTAPSPTESTPVAKSSSHVAANGSAKLRSP